MRMRPLPLLLSAGGLLSTGSRLLLWYLLTNDASRANLLVGLAVALLLPRSRLSRLPLRPLAGALARSVLAVPRAYGEALALIVAGERLESRLGTSPSVNPAHPVLVFLEVFRITLTPFSIALGLAADGRSYRVHELRPAPRRGPPAADLAAPPGGLTP